MKVNGDSRVWVMIFLAYALIAFAFSDKIVSFIAAQNWVMIIILTTFLDPVYLIFLWFLYERYSVGGLVAGFFFSIAAGTVSLPHLLL